MAQPAVYIAHFASAASIKELESVFAVLTMDGWRRPSWLDYMAAFALPSEELQALRLRQQRREDGRPLGYMYWGSNG